MTAIIHALNRGVDQRKIFLNDKDRLRFIHDLYEFNDQDNVDDARYTFLKMTKMTKINRTMMNNNVERKRRKLLVTIHAFCLMSNHYHLLLSEACERGISRFMHKLNKGYSRYFNEKYDRVGTLFQGKYKSIPVMTDAHFIHLPFYIHFNPLDMQFPEWRDRKIKNIKACLAFLEKYRWSSHLDYAGIKNFPSITQREFLTKHFGDSEQYKAAIISWLQDLDLNMIEGVALESTIFA